MDGSGSVIIVNYDELIEYQKFRDFLPTKNGIDIFRLTGKDNIGGYMRILINASPERLTQITYYDGAGNQMYPPTTIEFSKIVEYILMPTSFRISNSQKRIKWINELRDQYGNYVKQRKLCCAFGYGRGCKAT